MSQRILLITPKFYGIETEIKKELELSGYEVLWIENKILKFDYHGTNSKLRFLRRIYFLFFFPHIRYLRKELKLIKDTRFDILLSINGQILCPYLLSKLKSKNPSLVSILFIWDSFSVYSFKKEFKLFDKIYTFDKTDSLKYGIEYKPNFYVTGENRISNVQEFDLFFAGKFCPFRLAAGDKVTNFAEKSSLRLFMIIWPAHLIFPHNRYVYFLLRKICPNNNWTQKYLLNFEAIEGIIQRKFITPTCLSHKELQPYLLCSNVILDLPYNKQTGYSHVLIEALANGKKVITKNSNILNESFYNPEQVHVTEDLDLEKEYDWINEKRTFQIDKYFYELELSQWLKSVINFEVA